MFLNIASYIYWWNTFPLLLTEGLTVHIYRHSKRFNAEPHTLLVPHLHRFYRVCGGRHAVRRLQSSNKQWLILSINATLHVCHCWFFALYAHIVLHWTNTDYDKLLTFVCLVLDVLSSFGWMLPFQTLQPKQEVPQSVSPWQLVVCSP